jgi:hypothetical protein
MRLKRWYGIGAGLFLLALLLAPAPALQAQEKTPPPSQEIGPNLLINRVLREWISRWIIRHLILAIGRGILLMGRNTVRFSPRRAGPRGGRRGSTAGQNVGYSQ